MNIVITGASRGIGRAIAEAFASQGHSLFLCGRDAGRLEKAVTSIGKAFPQSPVQGFVADLSDKAAVQGLAARILDKGIPDILVNNAGKFKPGNVLDEPDGLLESQLQVNLLSAYHFTRALVPAMLQKKSGHIFNICSVASLQAYPGGGAYSISKFALNGFSQNLRRELMPHGIKVTAVFPGAVLTDSWGGYDNSGHRIMEAADIAEMVLAASRLSPGACVEEIRARPQLGDL